MIVKHFDFNTLGINPPQTDGWVQSWHGYYRLRECWTPQKDGTRQGYMSERDFERDCFLSILADIDKERVNMLELGAGWGEWCLALAGVINYGVIPVIPTSYRCLAVEGEPTHCKWIREHFELQDINGAVMHGAVSSKNGKCRFGIEPDPASNYGQAINYPVNSGLQLRGVARYLRNLVLKRTVKVPMHTVDRLMGIYGFNRVDIMHIDVQGAEYEVMQGAGESIKNGLIDYLLIGTHHRKLNDKLKRLLLPNFDLVVEIYPNSVGRVGGFAPIECQDGIQLYRRRNM